MCSIMAERRHTQLKYWESFNKETRDSTFMQWREQDTLPCKEDISAVWLVEPQLEESRE